MMPILESKGIYGTVSLDARSSRGRNPDSADQPGDPKMAIATAVQRGSSVYVYDEKGRQLFSKSAGGPKGGLQGYTASTVSIRQGSSIYVYDEQGRQISSISAG